MRDLRHPSLNAAVESRHEQVRKLWDDMRSGVGVKRGMDRQTAILAMAPNPEA